LEFHARQLHWRAGGLEPGINPLGSKSQLVPTADMRRPELASFDGSIDLFHAGLCPRRCLPNIQPDRV
jgi:hypothetical protein